MIVPQLTLVGQASVLTKPPSTKRRARTKRVYVPAVVYSTQPSSPTLQQAQEAAAGCLADLLIAWVEAHGGHATFDAFESTACFHEAEGEQHGV